MGIYIYIVHAYDTLVKRKPCQAKCSSLEILILAILINEGRLHGYALKKRIMELTKNGWNPSIGTLYRTLSDLLEKGYVRKEAAGRRNLYTVTESGAAHFAEASRDLLTRKMGLVSELLRAYARLAGERGPADRAFAENAERLRAALLEVLAGEAALRPPRGAREG